ncbi:ribonuclease H-like [Microplitis demolitor]|uniref:ribonuclease H-like n=1 Tax=Microplitis demolitor TaxID=69319 RepID=UPI0006D51C7B|nr:ribonuclease H-like [Microplitis demolitor]
MPFYLVLSGHKPGIYNSWADCREQIISDPYPVFKQISFIKESHKYLQYWQLILHPLNHLFERNAEGRITIFTDGSCFRNGSTESATGLGIYLRPNHPQNLSHPCSNRKTNNGTELEAILQALKILRKFDLTKKDFFTDSEYLCNGLNPWYENWKERDWITSTGKPVSYKEELEYIKTQMEARDIKIYHVSGHEGIYGNEQADQLAKDGAKLYELFKTKAKAEFNISRTDTSSKK